jgi:hypothetical protein
MGNSLNHLVGAAEQRRSISLLDQVVEHYATTSEQTGR